MNSWITKLKPIIGECMTIQAINSTSNNISFGKTKKTARGNEYQVSNIARTTGGTVGLLSGALAAKLAANTFKTTGGKRMFIQSLNNIGKDLSILGKGAERHKNASNGIKAICAGIALIGMFVGAAIGGTIDSHNNQKRAKAVDKAAKANA